jgi:hypothetical protein
MEGQSAASKVAEIRNWHLERGFRDFGYHAFIDRDGTIVQGRTDNQIGAHVKGHNAKSIGVCLAGGHGSSEHDSPHDHYTPEQLAALRNYIEGKKATYPSITKVRGHNEVAAKACPGFNVAKWYAEKKERKTPLQSTTVQAAVGAAATTGGTVFTAISKLDPVAQYILLATFCVTLLFLGWIVSERLKRWAKGDR